MGRHVEGFSASCGTCSEGLVVKTDGYLEALLERTNTAQANHACKASLLRQLSIAVYNKIVGPRIYINGKRVKP